MTPADAMTSEIYVADSDLSFRSAVASKLETAGYRVSSFSDAPSLSAALRSKIPDCIVLDHEIKKNGNGEWTQDSPARTPLPVVVTAHKPDIDQAVTAMKNGARDFVAKPCTADHVVNRVQELLDRQKALPVAKFEYQMIKGGDRLTPRERDVLQKIAMGASNKEAGRQLGISPRTVEVHRARIMEKLGARNTADLIRIVYSPNI